MNTPFCSCLHEIENNLERTKFCFTACAYQIEILRQREEALKSHKKIVRGPLSVRDHKFCMRQPMSEDNKTPIGFIHDRSLLYEMISPNGRFGKKSKMCGTWRLCERCRKGYEDLGWKLILIEERPEEKLKIFESRNIKDYKLILHELEADWGKIFWSAILMWCDVLDNPYKDDGKYWQVWVIQYEGKVIGICGLFAHKKDYVEELWLGWFGIIPDYRNKKIGEKALKFMEEHAKSLGCKKIFSYVDIEGKPLSFYFRNGYERISTVAEYLSEHPETDPDEFEETHDHVIRKELK